jgi:carbamate kinase
VRVVVALGGNALLPARRGASTVQHDRIRVAVDGLVEVAQAHELVVTHGNGPQIGVLSMQSTNTPGLLPGALDVLGAESEGLLGYLLELELVNRLPERDVATLLTLVEVDPSHRAFSQPSKPIGMALDAEEREAAGARGWTVVDTDGQWRRVVPSPPPAQLGAPAPIRQLVDAGTVVICGGGGGIPVANRDGELVGVEAVVDKALTSALVADAVDADLLVLATDVDAVYDGWGTDHPVAVPRLAPSTRAAQRYAAGSMGPKVEAACAFASTRSRRAIIGSLPAIPQLVQGCAGTIIETG